MSTTNQTDSAEERLFAAIYGKGAAADPGEGAAADPGEVVKIYVRLVDGDQDQRLISFKIPPGLDALELLERGFAVDGNQAVATVIFMPEAYRDDEAQAYQGPFGAWSFTLIDALSVTQRELVKFLREHGFTPQFA